MGKEFRTGLRDALFASTPPLEALRLIVSRAATAGLGEEKKELMINDVSRAYLFMQNVRVACMSRFPQRTLMPIQIIWADFAFAFTARGTPRCIGSRPYLSIWSSQDSSEGLVTPPSSTTLNETSGP